MYIMKNWFVFDQGSKFLNYPEASGTPCINPFNSNKAVFLKCTMNNVVLYELFYVCYYSETLSQLFFVSTELLIRYSLHKLKLM